MCDASQKEKSIAGKITAFSDDMVAQAKQVFGDDNAIFNNMKKSYDAIVDRGTSQHGFSQAEINAKNAAAIENNALQFRNISGAVKSGQAGFGGGNTVSGAGVTTGQNLQVAQAAAEHTAEDLNRVQQEDFATGRDNFWRASASEQALPGVFNNIPGINKTTSEGQDAALREQQSLDAQSGWWKAPVMGLVKGVTSMATGGLSSLATGSFGSPAGFPTSDSQTSA